LLDLVFHVNVLINFFVCFTFFPYPSTDLSTARTVSMSSSPEMPIHHTNGTVFCPEFLNPEQKGSCKYSNFWVISAVSLA